MVSVSAGGDLARSAVTDGLSAQVFSMVSPGDPILSGPRPAWRVLWRREIHLEACRYGGSVFCTLVSRNVESPSVRVIAGCQICIV